MSKKKGKKGRYSDEFRTCIIGMTILLIIGIGLILYGKIWNNISPDDINVVPAKIVSIVKVPSDNSEKTKESLKENGFTQEEVDYDLEVEYEFILDGVTHTHIAREPYRIGETMSVGDTAELKYVVKNGEVIVDPSSNSVYTVIGYVIVILGILAGICAFILRPKSK